VFVKVVKVVDLCIYVSIFKVC